MLILVAVRSKVKVYSFLIAGTAGLNPVEWKDDGSLSLFCVIYR